MAVVLNSFICKRPFFANKNITFANLLRTHVYLSRGSHVKVGRQICRQKKHFSKLRTQKKTLAELMLEPWRPWQLEALTWTFRTTPVSYLYDTSAVLKSHQGGKSHIVPMARRRYRKVTSGSGKSHQGRRITMTQPVSSIIGDLLRSHRSIAHSDDLEGYKFIQTISWQLILLDLNILS